MSWLHGALAAASVAAFLPCAAMAQTTGSAGCAALIQSAANGAAARVNADDKDIAQPQSVKTFTCLDRFFQGVGLNVVVNLLNPATLLQNIEGQLCKALTSEWQKTIGTTQCGITLTGFNLGFLNGHTLGGGLSCPKLSFGGGGPPVGYIGVGANNSGKLYITGDGVKPTGYPTSNLTGLF
jgi:hypothetical protein